MRAGGTPSSELGLLIEIRADDPRARRDLRAELNRELGGGWSVAHLFRRPRSRDLDRFYLARGEVPASPAYPLSAMGYDLARTLADRLDVRVEPDLPSSAFRRDGTHGAERPAGPGPLSPAAPPDAVDADDKWWSVKAIRAPQAWDTPPLPGGVAVGAGVLIGQIDTGYTNHPEIYPDALDLAIDWDVIDNDDDARDPLIKRWWFPLDNPGHGTGTSCVMGSRPAGEVVGVAPGALVVPIRAIESVVQVLDSDVARAVDYARSAGCPVISMSLGGRGFIGLQAAIRQAVDHGVIVMAAAGNYVGFVTAPASYPECLAVAATTALNQPWSGSSHGAQVDICAPGAGVWTAAANSGPAGPVFSVEAGDGTSFSVAELAGVAALWLGQHGADALRARYGAGTQEAFRQLIVQTCIKPVPWDDTAYGAGIVDAKALIDAPLPSQADVHEAAVSAGLGTDPWSDDLQQLAATWTDRSPQEIHRSLTARLGRPGDTKTLARFAGEIRFQAGEDPTFRRILLPPRTGDDDEPLPPLLPGLDVDSLVRYGVSRELATALISAATRGTDDGTAGANGRGELG